MLGDSLGTDDGTDIGPLDNGFASSNYGNHDGSTLGVSLGSTDRSALGTDEGITMSSQDYEVLGITLGDDDEITLGFDEGTELGFSVRSFNGSVASNLKVAML